MKPIIDIINSIDTTQPNVNPTEIYNEGWMTRLLVYYSIQEKSVINGIDFGKIKNWTSEALISSPFIEGQNKKLREGYTHADMAIGDFDVDYIKRGEIGIGDKAKLFGIIEAKMGSNLSKGTKHAPDYNQASRNLACIAQNTYDKPTDIFFSVAAPGKKIEKHDILSQVDLSTMIYQIEARFALYDANDPIRANEQQILSKAKTCKVWVLSYEDWIAQFQNDSVRDLLNEFYEKCLDWNRINRK